ncbi:MAG: GNAT family N-acetyltransferase [Anaerolineales bacterium]
MNNMQITNVSPIVYLDADEKMRDHVGREWGEKAARHMHLVDGFSIIALDHELLIGLISAYRKKLPLLETSDWYIDILEVHKDYRRNGIASHLIRIVCERAKKEGIYQIRSWSSEDKIEAIPMWKALGFGLCPATTYPQGKEVKGYFVARVL